MDTEGPSGTYRIVIRGELSDRFAPLFEGMKMERRKGMTIVTGRVGDQAQLIGLIGQAQESGSSSSPSNKPTPQRPVRRTRA